MKGKVKYQSPLIVVADMERSKAFYRDVLGLRAVSDFGANVTLTGGVSLQTLDSWCGFISAQTDEINFGGMDGELYFCAEDIDGFYEKLKASGAKLVHGLVEHPWGQRAVRFFDPDRHVIEVGETLNAVAARFAALGMTVEQVAQRMDVPLSFAERLMQKA